MRYDRSTRILYLRMWGYWSEPLAIEYRNAVRETMAPLTPAKPSHVLADISRYPAQKPEVQKYHAELMAASASHGLYRTANLVSMTLTEMQIRRLSEESGIELFRFFQEEQEAVDWLLLEEPSTRG